MYNKSSSLDLSSTVKYYVHYIRICYINYERDRSLSNKPSYKVNKKISSWGENLRPFRFFPLEERKEKS